MPVIVRLTTGDDVLCILYQNMDESDTRMIMERPLRVISEEITKSPVQQISEQTVYAKVRTRFDRWMILSDVTMFPIFSDHVLSIAPLSEEYTNSYMEWADQLYAADNSFKETEAASLFSDTTISANTTTMKDNETKQSYFDFILHNFMPKGKPN